MKSVKKFIKRFIPKSLFSRIVPAFHLLQAMFWSSLFLRPAKHQKVIAVTGTNGKTTTANYIGSILEAAGHKVGLISTSHFQIGDKIIQNKENRTVSDPMKSNWLLRRMRWARVDWVVMEVTSHSLEQNRIWGVPIKAAVFTNLTPDHLDYHKTMENYAEAKAKLFKKNPEFIALNADAEWFDFFDQFPASNQKMSYGTDQKADAQIESAKLSSSQSEFTIAFDKTDKRDFITKLVGKFNVYNAAAAATITYLLHIDKAAIVKGIANLSGVPGRMQVIESDKPFNIMVDFAHTPDGLENVLDTLKNTTSDRLILVFGGTGNRDLERPLLGEVAAKYADRIVLTDDEPHDKDPAELRAHVLEGIRKAKGVGKTTEVEGRRNGIKKALDIAKRGDTVVITGMGDQEFMKVGDDYVEWNDVSVINEILSDD